MALQEMYESRKEIPNKIGVTILRYYTMLQSDLTAGAGGYTAVTLPKVGDACTWTGATWNEFASTPEIIDVHLNPRFTKTLVLITVTASARRIFVE